MDDRDRYDAGMNVRRARRIGARTIEELWKAVGSICDHYTPDECWNYLRHARYASD
jgi:hypothetical protein